MSAAERVGYTGEYSIEFARDLPPLFTGRN